MQTPAQSFDAGDPSCGIALGGALAEDLLTSILQQSPQAILIGTTTEPGELRLLRANPAFTQITGYSLAEAQTASLEVLLAPKGQTQEWADLMGALILKQRFDKTIQARRRDGTLFWANLRAYPVSDETRKLHWVLSFSDSTAAQEPLLELRQSEERYRLLADNSRDLITVHRFDGLCIYASPAIRDILGFEPGEFVHKPLIDFFHPDDCALVRRILERHFHNHPENIFVHRLRRKDGSFVWCETTSKTTWGLKDPQPGGIIAITRDISKRKAAEQELNAMHMLLSSVFESVPVGLCVTDAQGRITQCNRAFASILASPPAEIAGQNLGTLLAGDNISDSIRSAEIRRKDGVVINASYTITTLGLSRSWHSLVTLTDLTEQISLDARLQEAQRLESLGTLAGGIAHDFNNLLAIILGYASLLKQAAPDNTRIAEYGDTIIDAGKRGADVVRQLMLYAHQHEPLLSREDVHTTIGGILVKNSAHWPESIRLDCCFQAARSTLLHDPEQLGRAVEHLLENAKAAITGHGTVRLITGDRETRELDGSVSRWLEISIEDNGRGMDEATRARMFEPFFTRDRGPQVPGLGLALVYGIVKAHQGHIDVKSAPGQGTRVTIFLPHPPEEGQQKHEVTPVSEYSLRQGAVVLFVEDEADIAKLWTSIFARHGWEMHWARTGEDAVSLFQTHRDRIEVLFCDIGLPGTLSGWEVATLIHAAKPGIPIVLASGFFKRGGDTPSALGDRVELVDKPYQPADVMKRLQKLTGRLP